MIINHLVFTRFVNLLLPFMFSDQAHGSQDHCNLCKVPGQVPAVPVHWQNILADHTPTTLGTAPGGEPALDQDIPDQGQEGDPGWAGTQKYIQVSTSCGREGESILSHNTDE